jgi:hypothetical protein
MADYRLSAGIISRSDGKSIVAAAAYRSANKLLDERTGDIKDYSRRHRSVLYTQILTPENAPEWMRDRQRLWNAVERREDRSTKPGTAQLARDIELSLPYELTHEQRLELVREFVKAEFVDRGMVADIAIHAPPRRGDGRNHHAHVLLTMRHIKGDGFGLKNREWNRDELLEHWRERWEVYQNRALAMYGHPEEHVDHRSLKDQGIDREPTKHLGPGAQQMEDQGIHSDRGDENRRIKEANDNLALLKKELAESEQRLAELKRQLAVERMERIEKIVGAAKAFWEKAERLQANPQGPAKEPEPPGPKPRRLRPSGTRPLTPERMEQIQKTVRAAKAFWEGTEQLKAAAQRLQNEDSPPYHAENSPPPVTGGGKAASMPDDLSEIEKLAAQPEADRQKQAQEAEQARQDQAGKDEEQRQAEARKEQDRVQNELIAADNRLKELGQIYRETQENRERLIQQAHELAEANARFEREASLRLNAEQIRQSPVESHLRDNNTAIEDRRQVILDKADRLLEGDIRNPHSRYVDALQQHYEYAGNPYEGLAKAAIAEHASFRNEQDALSKEIAKSTDPKQREALEIQRKIEGYEYLMVTGERIAVQSEIITGRKNSDEAVRMRERINGKDIFDENGNKIGFEDGYKQKAQELRQQYRSLQAERMEEKQQVRPDPAKASEHEGSQQPGTLRNKLDAVIRKVDDAAKANERTSQQKKDRENQQERDRDR